MSVIYNNNNRFKYLPCIYCFRNFHVICIFLSSKTVKRNESDEDDIFSTLIDETVRSDDVIATSQFSDVEDMLNIPGAIKLINCGRNIVILSAVDAGYSLCVFCLNTVNDVRAETDVRRTGATKSAEVLIQIDAACKQRSHHDFPATTPFLRRLSRAPAVQLALLTSQYESEKETDCRIVLISERLFTALFGADIALLRRPVAVVGSPSGHVFTCAVFSPSPTPAPSLLYDMKQPILGIYGLLLSDHHSFSDDARRKILANDVIAIVSNLGKVTLIYTKDNELVMHEKFIDGPVCCADVRNHVMLHSTLSDVFVSEFRRGDDGSIDVVTSAVGMHLIQQLAIRPPLQGSY